MNKPESEATVTDLQASLRALKGILKNVDAAGIDKTITSANDVLDKVDATIDLLDGVLSPNSPLQYNLIQVTGELDETAKSIRALVESLERHPNSLIFGRPSGVENEE